MKLDTYEVNGEEKKALQKTYYISKKESIYKIIINEKIPLEIIYTSLHSTLKKDLNKILKKELTMPNTILIAKKLFSLANTYVINRFASPEELNCFSGKYATKLFLAKDFNELCKIGTPRKINLPHFVMGRVSNTTLVYRQKFFTDFPKKYGDTIPKTTILGDAHELLHMFFEYERIERYGKTPFRPPLLFSEGLTVICAKQISKDFEKEFISAERLFKETNINVFENDEGLITESRHYQSAGQFMDYLLKYISKKEDINYKEAFQKMFIEIGNPKHFNKEGKFDSKKFMKKVFKINIHKEYERFLEKKNN